MSEAKARFLCVVIPDGYVFYRYNQTTGAYYTINSVVAGTLSMSIVHGMVAITHNVSPFLLFSTFLGKTHEAAMDYDMQVLDPMQLL